MVVFTVFVVAVVSAASMTHPVLSADSQLAKRSFFEYVTGKYLVPQNCKVFFNWEDPCIVGGVMNFTVKVSSLNITPNKTSQCSCFGTYKLRFDRTALLITLFSCKTKTSFINVMGDRIQFATKTTSWWKLHRVLLKWHRQWKWEVPIPI